MKENQLENKNEVFLVLLDYFNEIQSFGWKIAEGNIKNPVYRTEEFAMRNLNEYVNRNQSVDKFADSDYTKFYTIKGELNTEERKSLFFEKKKELDLLVSEFNQELKKEDFNLESLKNMLEKMKQLIGQ